MRDGGLIDTDVIRVPPLAVTRRQLLKAGGVSALAAAGAAWPQREPGVFGLSAPGHLSRATYLPLVGQNLRVVGAGATLELAAVDDLQGHNLRDRDDAFALTFHGRRGSALEQGTYTLEHASLGRFPLFLLPGGRGRYRAVVDRSRGGRP